MKTNKINIAENSKVSIIWNVLPMDYSRETENAIISKFAVKYNIPKENIKIETKFISKNEKNEIIPFSNEIITNINDTVFQQNLFKSYLDEKGIADYDFNKIAEIDGFINNYIDYDKYDKNKRYTIKWIKWDNFMSYGEGNFIDFTNLNKLVLLSSTPANQGGKTTFSIDLIRFLLFGKVTSREDNWTLAKVFNKHIPEATQVNVEGCITIDGVDYIINRKVTRPALDKRTDKSKVTHKVNYYKVIENQYVNLADEDNLEETTSTLTNKAIKEAIGNERDFDLMISVNSDNLKGLISLKETDRGRLLSRWIGLLPLEEKDKIAREYFNKSVTPKLLLNKYNKDELIKRNEELNGENIEFDQNIKKLNEQLEESNKKLFDLKLNRDTLLQSKTTIDSSLLKVDVKTIETQITSLIEKGNIKKTEKENNELKLKEIGEVSFDENYYNSLIEKEKQISININTHEINISNFKKDIAMLQSAEFCKTCGARLKDVDNTFKIKSANDKINELTFDINKLNNTLLNVIDERKKLDEERRLFNEKNKLELIIQKNEVDLENLRMEFREAKRILKDIEANKSAIENNNRIENALNVNDVNIKTEEQIKNNLERNINDNKTSIEINKKEIDNNTKICETLVKTSDDKVKFLAGLLPDPNCCPFLVEFESIPKYVTVPSNVHFTLSKVTVPNL